MATDASKNRIFVLEMIITIGLVIFIAAIALNRFFPTPLVPASDSTTPGIVGFVPVEINNQPLDLEAKEPSSYVLFTDRTEQFQLTSLRLSGTVIGNGRAEIVLDNGLGQELVIYSNIKTRQGNLITGMAVSEENPMQEDVPIKELPEEEAWLRLADNEDDESGSPETNAEGMRIIQGEFENTCKDTCYMNMNMQEGLYYTLRVKVDPGTEVKINSLKYTLEV